MLCGPQWLAVLYVMPVDTQSSCGSSGHQETARGKFITSIIMTAISYRGGIVLPVRRMVAENNVWRVLLELPEWHLVSKSCIRRNVLHKILHLECHFETMHQTLQMPGCKTLSLMDTFRIRHQIQFLSTCYIWHVSRSKWCIWKQGKLDKSCLSTVYTSICPSVQL